MFAAHLLRAERLARRRVRAQRRGPRRARRRARLARGAGRDPQAHRHRFFRAARRLDPALCLARQGRRRGRRRAAPAPDDRVVAALSSAQGPAAARALPSLEIAGARRAGRAQRDGDLFGRHARDRRPADRRGRLALRGAHAARAAGEAGVRGLLRVARALARGGGDRSAARAPLFAQRVLHSGRRALGVLSGAGARRRRHAGQARLQHRVVPPGRRGGARRNEHRRARACSTSRSRRR